MSSNWCLSRHVHIQLQGKLGGTDKIAKMVANNHLDEDVAMATLFGPLDQLFDKDVDLIDLEAEEEKQARQIKVKILLNTKIKI